MKNIDRQRTTLPTLAYSSFETRSTCAPTKRSTKRFPVNPGSWSTRTWKKRERENHHWKNPLNLGWAVAKMREWSNTLEVRSIRKQSRLKYLAATAVARQWLLCIPPTVIMQSAPCITASANRNSSFLTLLPLNCIPERSSRYKNCKFQISDNRY